MWSGLSLSWAAAAGHQKEVGGQTDGRSWGELDGSWELGEARAGEEGMEGTHSKMWRAAHTHTHQRETDLGDKLFGRPFIRSSLVPGLPRYYERVPGMNGRFKWELLVPTLVTVAAKQRLGSL